MWTLFSRRTRARALAIFISTVIARFERSRKKVVQISARSAQTPGADSCTARCNRLTRGGTTPGCASSIVDFDTDPPLLKAASELLQLVNFHAGVLKRRDGCAETGLLRLAQTVITEQMQRSVTVSEQERHGRAHVF